MSTGSSSQGPNINVTPLIDVLLVLLIIFMVITPLKPHKFETKIPEKPPDTLPEDVQPDPGLLVVTVNKERKLELNTQPVTIEELGTQLKDTLDKRTADRKVLFIKAPKDLPYGFIVNVIDVVKGAGASPIGLQIDYLDEPEGGS
jgi:biopolymer transport protein ExbD